MTGPGSAVVPAAPQLRLIAKQKTRRPCLCCRDAAIGHVWAATGGDEIVGTETPVSK